jgi:hypothetical protein
MTESLIYFFGIIEDVKFVGSKENLNPAAIEK